MSDDSSLFSTTPGNTPQTFNVGVKRITGAQLLAAGKRKNWVYFITDIQVCAVYENAGRNVWLGMNGVPVAGDSSIQASLIPVQGQRFYNLTTGPQEWKGTSWGAGSYAISNKLTPRIQIVEADTMLSPEVEHYVVVDNLDITFPSDDFSSIETSLDVYISPDVTGTTLFAPPGMVFNTPGQIGVTSLNLNAAGIYKLVRTTSTIVEVISTDNVDPVLRQSQNLADVPNPAIARENLDLYSKEEVANIAGFLTAFGPGIGISGSPSLVIGDPLHGFYRIYLQFETDPLAIVNANASSPNAIPTPWAIKQAMYDTVNNAVGMSQFNNISGLAFNSQSFSVSTNVNLVSIDIGAATWLFNSDPYLRNQAIIVRDMPASNLAWAIPSGASYYYITLSTAGGYVASPTYDPTDFSKVLVARVFCIDNQIKWSLASPAVASSDMSLRAGATAISGGLLKSKAGGQWLSREPSAVFEEGVGWSQSQANPHTFSLGAADDILIDIINTDGTIHLQQQQYVKGNQLADGSAVASTEYTVQIVYRMINGRYLVPRPAVKYTSKTLADAAIASVTYNKPAWMAEALEVCRWVVKGDQFQGSGAYNLASTTNFESKAITSYAGGQVAGGASNWEVLGVTGGGTLQSNKIYIFQDSNNYSFPAIAPVGQGVGFMALPGAVPSLMVQNYPTVFLRDMELQEDHDGILLEVPWVLEYVFSTGTYFGY